MHFRSAVVKIYRAPPFILTQLLIITLIQIRSVKLPQPFIILAEMSRYPVHYYSYSVLVRCLYELSEFIRISIAARRRVIARCLISPTPVERVFRQRHKLYMRVVHFLHIRYQPLRQLPVTQIHVFFVAVSSRFSLPTSRVHFVYQHRLTIRTLFLLRLHIFPVFPFISFQIEQARRCLRFSFRIHSIRVCFQNVRSAPLRLYCIFVSLSFFQPFYKYTPSFAILQAAHHMYAGIPIIKFPDHADGLCIFRPNCETHAFFAVNFGKMRAEHFICVIICTVMEQVQIILVKRSSFHKKFSLLSC